MSRNYEIMQRAADKKRSFVGADVVRATPRPRFSAEETGLESGEWWRAFKILKTWWRVSALFAAAVFVTVAAATLLMRPVYEPDARVQVDPPGTEIFSLSGNNSGGSSPDYLDTQAKNLQNDELALEVIRKLQLDKNPDFGGGGKSSAKASDRTGDAAIRLTPAENDALVAFTNARKIERDAASRLITVSVGAHDPVIAASATNTLVTLFIERDYKLRNDAILQSSQWLQRQLEDIRERMQESNRALTDFQKASGIGAIGEDQNTFTEQMIELSRQLTQAQADRIQLESYVKEMNGARGGSLPQVNTNPVVQELTKKLAEVRAEMAQARAIYGDNHPNAKKLRMQADELQSQLDAQRGSIVKDVKTSFNAANARERLMEAQVQGASKRMILLSQYNALKKEADANTQLYGALYQKIKEAAIAAETKSSNVRVVDRARILPHPTRPRRGKNMALGLLAGLVGGIALAFVCEALDTRIRTAEDMRRCVGANIVAVVPQIGRSETDAVAWHGRLLPRSRSSEDEVSKIFILERPNSPEAEALRGIYTSMRLSMGAGGAPRVILILSPLPGEGKTMISTNLALALAQHGNTCIVDGDLRKREVCPALGISADTGLADVLSGTQELDEALVRGVQMPTLTVLPAGSSEIEPGILIASERMAEVIGRLRQEFEFVVIDSPPLLPFADGRALSALVDGIVMVGRSGVTTRDDLKQAMDLLQQIRSAPVYEVVLNGTATPVTDYRYYRYKQSA